MRPNDVLDGIQVVCCKLLSALSALFAIKRVARCCTDHTDSRSASSAASSDALQACTQAVTNTPYIAAKWDTHVHAAPFEIGSSKAVIKRYICVPPKKKKVTPLVANATAQVLTAAKGGAAQYCRVQKA